MTVTAPGALAAVLLFSAAGLAQAQDDIVSAIAGGDVGINLRYRLEHVTQDGLPRDALASTLRTKLNYRTGELRGFSAFVEFENVAVLGETTYNNTLNGKVQRPVIADPASTEGNQAYLRYRNDRLVLTAGRQGINLGEQRWIGTVGFRQNDQTYDGARADIAVGENFSFTYVYVFNVNRIFSDDHPNGDLDTNTHLLQADYAALPWLNLRGFAYLLDIEEAGLAGLASNTYGVRAHGVRELWRGTRLGYVAEYARQTDTGANPADYAADYVNVEGSIAHADWTLKAGYELLGSDNGVGLKTPLATLHKFNGWADVFLLTPSAGLEDIYVTGSYRVPSGVSFFADLGLTGVYHRFTSDTGGLDYGDEFGWQLAWPINEVFSASLKGAHYRTDGFATDRDKIWFTIIAAF